VLAGGLVLAAGIAALAVLPRELVPDGAARELVVSYRLPTSLSPEAARRLGTEVGTRTREVLGHGEDGVGAEMAALQWPEDRTASAASSLDRDETGRLVLSFPDPAAATHARGRLAAMLSRLPDVDCWVEPRTGAFVESIERAGRRLEIVATAATPERAAALAGRVEDRLRRTAGWRVKSDLRDRPQSALLLSWDAGRLAALGADRDRLEDQVRSGLGEQRAGRVRIDGVEPEIVVRGVEPRDPGLLPLALPASAEIPGALGSVGALPLAALARLTPGARPAALERQDGRAAVRLELGGAGADGLHRADPEAILAALPLAADEGVSPSGQALELRLAFSQLRLALVLSLVLVFLTIAAIYESFTLPLAVMATVPVAFGGALGLLAVTGQSLDILSFLGLVLLGGIVVNNAIVLVHRAEQHRTAGLAMDGAIRRAAAERYRPILMTTLTTLLGMLPLALLGGEGVELRRGLAVAVLGGLTTSTFASLLLVPVLYRALSGAGRRS
jgi:HAE1 family hydrophobic/amphiphilic exporter-1